MATRDTMTWQEKAEAMREDPALRPWEQMAVEGWIAMDPVKALNHVDYLQAILQERLDEISLQQSPSG